MAIKRGVSIYSYQQEQFFKRMTLRDMVKKRPKTPEEFRRILFSPMHRHCIRSERPLHPYFLIFMSVSII